MILIVFILLCALYGIVLIYNWIWQKTHQTGFLNSHYRPMLQFEDICVFSKSGAGAGSKNNNMNYFPQGLIEINETKKNRRNTGGMLVHDGQNCGHKNLLNSGKEYEQKFTGYPSNIIVYDRDTHQIHPTQKPVKLLEYLIKTYTLDDNLVLDNCIGSGTTAIACINTNRHWIGMEKDEKYYELAKERIEQHKASIL